MKARTICAALFAALAFGVQADDMSGMKMDGMDSMQAAPTASAEGTIKAMDASRGTVTLAHGAVPSLQWPPMTMAFKSTQEQMKGLKVGDEVVFDFRTDGGAASIVNIRRK